MTVDEAKQIINDRSNGVIYGMSISKGGRIWLDGEFTLEELKAVTVLLQDLVDKTSDTIGAM